MVPRMILAPARTVVGVKVASPDCGGDISDENSNNPSWVVQRRFRVNFKVGLSAIANEDELSIGKVAHDLV